MGGVPAPALLDALAAEGARTRLRGFTTQAVANTAWSFASAAHAAPALFQRWRRRSSARPRPLPAARARSPRVGLAAADVPCDALCGQRFVSHLGRLRAALGARDAAPVRTPTAHPPHPPHATRHTPHTRHPPPPPPPRHCHRHRHRHHRTIHPAAPSPAEAASLSTRAATVPRPCPAQVCAVGGRARGAGRAARCRGCRSRCSSGRPPPSPGTPSPRRKAPRRDPEAAISEVISEVETPRRECAGEAAAASSPSYDGSEAGHDKSSLQHQV